MFWSNMLPPSKKEEDGNNYIIRTIGVLMREWKRTEADLS
jgi:hypothetical protein